MPVTINGTTGISTPGQDYSAEDPKVQAVCAAVHKPEVIAAYQAAQQAA